MRSLLAAIAAGVVLAPAAAPARVFPNRVQVTAKEFYYVLSSRTVKAGPAVIQFVNYGEDPHDLRIQRADGGKIVGTRQLQPGEIRNVAITLTPGKYELWCSVANHRQLGMAATLVVKPA